MPKILSNYPFKDIAIELIEGFSFYDGNLLDPINTPHKGIDYVLRKDKQFVSFEVYSMHEGLAYQGNSDSWGKFVYVYYPNVIDNFRYSTIYAHLNEINPVIPFLEKDQDISLKHLKTAFYLGTSGITGWTNNLIQLHIEVHRKDTATNSTEKCDPYGIYDRKSSGKYPQPGQMLVHQKHYWKTDFPEFAK